MFSDSDSHLAPDVISKMVPHFQDQNVGLVAGKVVIRQQHSLIMWWQNIEYLFAQALIKIAQVGSGASITVAPGPICMYRRKKLLELGGFKDRTIVEDFDMTLEVVHSGHKAVYEPRAISWTSAPESFAALARQRTRWDRGNLQTWGMYWNSLFTRKQGIFSLFWLPYLFVYGFGSTIFQAILFLALSFTLIFEPSPVTKLYEVLLFTAIFQVISFIQYASVLYLDGNLRKNTFIATITNIPYIFFLFWIRLKAIYREITHKEVSWTG